MIGEILRHFRVIECAVRVDEAVAKTVHVHESGRKIFADDILSCKKGRNFSLAVSTLIATS